MISTTNQVTNLNDELNDIKRISNESLRLSKGPDFSVDLSDWLTIKDYAEKYNVSVQVVTNWINREIIPTDCIMQFTGLNNLKIIKDQPYNRPITSLS